MRFDRKWTSAGVRRALAAGAPVAPCVLGVLGAGALLAAHCSPSPSKVDTRTSMVTSRLLQSPRYWVGGAGDANSTAHWSSTSGGAAGQTVPTSTNDVIFDANSGFGPSWASNVVSDSGGTLTSHDITLATNQMIVWDSYTDEGGGVHAAVPLNCWGSASLANISPTVFTDLTFSGGESGTLTPTDVVFSNITINGSGRQVTLGGDLLGATTQLIVSNGTFVLNGWNINNVVWFEAGSSVLGASTIRAGSFIATQPSLNAGTSTVELGAGGTLSTAGATLYKVAFDGDATLYAGSAGTTFNTVTFRGGSTYSFENGQTTTFVHAPHIYGPGTTTFQDRGQGTQDAVFQCSESVTLDSVNLVKNSATGTGTWTATNSTADTSTTGWTVVTAPWTTVSQASPEGCRPHAVMTDGSILCAPDSSTHWYRLRPDATGHYESGTWSMPGEIANSNVGRLAFPNMILKDGRFWVGGGELVSDGDAADRAAHGQIETYDPVGNVWTAGLPYPYFDDAGSPQGIYDAAATVLANGKVFVSSSGGEAGTGHLPWERVAYLYDPDSPTSPWTETYHATPSPMTHEQGFTLLQDGRVFGMSAERASPGDAGATSTPAFLYDSDHDIWTETALPAQPLGDFCHNGDTPCSDEIGAQVLLYSGKVLVLGVAQENPPQTLGHNNIFDPASAQWSNDVPDGPQDEMVPTAFSDTAACAMRNGKVFSPVVVSEDQFGRATWEPYEFDPLAKQFNKTAPFPSGTTPNAMTSLALPNGQILLYAVPNLLLYTPTGLQETAGAPSITSVTYNAGSDDYTLTGTSLNGLTTGCTVGDDDGLATNYPIVFATNLLTGSVVYFRTYDFDQMAPMPGHAGSFTFALPPGVAAPPAGNYALTVSASGAQGSMVLPLGGKLFRLVCPTMVQNTSSSCQLELQQPAPPGGLTVTLTSTNTSALTVPASVVVPAGQSIASVAIQSHSVSSTIQVPVRATSGAWVQGKATITTQ